MGPSGFASGLGFDFAKPNLSLQLFFSGADPVSSPDPFASPDPSSVLSSKGTDSSFGATYSGFGVSHATFLACLLLTKGEVLSSSVPTGTNISTISNL